MLLIKIVRDIEATCVINFFSRANTTVASYCIFDEFKFYYFECFREGDRAIAQYFKLS